MATEDSERHQNPNPLPESRQALLKEVGEGRAGIYSVVREILDGVEEAAPWADLYYPPDDHDDLLIVVRGFLERLREAPVSLAGFLESLEEEGADFEESVRDDIDFYLSGINSMVERDLARLDELLLGLRMRFTSSIEEKAFICGLTADLKGKYTSALMGAAAGFLADEGGWPASEVESVLFPEKAEEASRNADLLHALDELAADFVELESGSSLVELDERWSRGERGDPYALSELVLLKGHLGHLLRESRRRALYSGDYHQLRRREAMLCDRLGELEDLHRATWSEDVRPFWARGRTDYSKLIRVLAEVVCLVDTSILARLIGGEQLAELERQTHRRRESGWSADLPGEEQTEDGEAVSRRWKSLLPLLADEDLRSFVDGLRREVAKRQSFVSVSDRAADDTSAATSKSPGLALELIAPSGEEGAKEAEAPPSEPKRSGALKELRERLEELRSPNNGKWNAFRMTERLLEKHGRIPPGMFASARPFVEEVEARLVPALERVAEEGLVAEENVHAVERYCRYLLEVEVSPALLGSDIGVQMAQLQGLLDALHGMSAGLLDG